MANNFSLIGRKEYQLTDKLTIHIPLISELRSSFDDEMEYFKLVIRVEFIQNIFELETVF